MKKNIKDMTATEKQERINHLSKKFYDVEARPSALLRDEMTGGTSDDFLMDSLRRLVELESRRYELEAEYTATVAPEMKKLKRISEYERDQLLAKQEREKIVPPFDPFRHDNRAETTKRHQQELAYLERKQRERIDKFEKSARVALDLCNKVIRGTFMAAISHLYQ